MQINGGLAAASTARRSVLSQLSGQVDRELALDAALVVSELVSNSVQHADVRAEETLVVELVRINGRLRISVIDHGSRLEPRLQPVDRQTPGGLGLFVVDQLSAAWGVARDGIGCTRVWCELALDGAR